MDISFASNKLEKRFMTESALKKAYGDRAKKIKLRYSVMLTVKCLEDLPVDPPIRRHKLKENRKGEYAVVIKDNWRITFEPNHEPIPLKENGEIDLSKVTKITILDVLDYH